MHDEEYGKMRALEDHYWWFVSRRRMALALLRRFAPHAQAVLDLGCGTGAMLSQLAGKPVGVDFSRRALEHCSERGLRRLVQGNAERVPLASSSFDAVVSLDTLEHVQNDEAAVAEVARLLRPGGLLVLNVPAFRWLWGPHDVALMHHRRYSRRQVAALLASAGLEPVWLSYSVFFLFPVVVTIRVLERLRRGPAEVRLPAVPGGLNRALVGLQDVETAALLRLPLPWGSSVVAVARKP